MSQDILTGQESIVIPANDRLKKKVGAKNLSDLVSDKKIQAAQDRSVHEAREQFMKDMYNDVARITQLASAVKEKPATEHETVLHEVREIAFRIKSRAGTFDFALASAVARLLHNFLEKHMHLSAKETHIVEVCASTLKAIFTNDIHGDGGKVGQELHKNLIDLIDNHAKA